MKNFDWQHLSLTIANLVGAFGPVVAAKMSASQIQTAHVVSGAVLLVLTQVASLFKTPPSAKVPSVPPVAILAIFLVGCSWFKANAGTLTQDGAKLVACEVAYIESTPAPTPQGAVTACDGLLLVDAINLFDALASKPGNIGAKLGHK